IHNTSSCEGHSTDPLCSLSLDAIHVLREHSRKNHDDFCLSYLWTYRQLNDGILGLAYVAGQTGDAGICGKFTSAVEQDSGSTNAMSFNTGMMTFVNHNFHMPDRVTQVLFSHELGHSFGSPHDYPSECVPGEGLGNYLMFDKATTGTMPNNRKFSPCSVRNMSVVLDELHSGAGYREDCLQEPRGPFCGNSIREEGEECDCGYGPEDCRETCCFPRQYSKRNRRACTLKPHAKCSPSNGACCTKACVFSNTSAICRTGDDCTFETFCNGSSGDCPHAPRKADGTLCNHGTQMCEAGECKLSICRKYSLHGCYLTGPTRTPEEMCLIACKKPGTVK
ncbi:unnamed protein product, partial [Ixodes hexagonus]